MQKWKSVFRLRRRVRIACEPIPWSAQGDPKIKEKTWHISEPTFLIKKCKNMRKRGPKSCPKGWGDFRGGGLGGALDGLWRPNLFLNTKSMPKVLQKWLQGCKNYTKRPGGLRGAIKIKVPDRKLLNSKKGMNCPTPKSLVPIRFLSVVSWHVMPVLSRCVVLCQFVFGYVRRCSVVSCCAVLYRALLYNVMGSCVALCYVRLCSSLLCCKKSWVRVCLCAGGPQVFVHFSLEWEAAWPNPDS